MNGNIEKGQLRATKMQKNSWVSQPNDYFLTFWDQINELHIIPIPTPVFIAVIYSIH